MDFMAIVILGSTIVSAIVMVIGPYSELRGKILFEHNKNRPRTKGRIGMMLIALGAILFLTGLLARNWFDSATVTPIVLIGYVVWFAGGFVAVARNEVIKICGEETERR